MKSDAFSEVRFLNDFYQTTFTGQTGGQGEEFSREILSKKHFFGVSYFIL